MTKSELDAMTKDELIAYADDNDIEVHSGWLKDQIVAEIVKAEKATTKSAKADSIKHHESRKAKIEAENEVNQGVSQELAENQEIANYKGPVQEGETREQLLDRIRKMRETPPKSEAELFRSEGQQKEYDAEVKAGQDAVAKATVERDKLLAASAEVERGEKNKAG